MNRKVTTNKHILPMPLWEIKLEQLSMVRTSAAVERVTCLGLVSGGSYCPKYKIKIKLTPHSVKCFCAAFPLGPPRLSLGWGWAFKHYFEPLVT